MNNYDKIASLWVEAQMRNPEYGMEYIRKAIHFADKAGSALDIGCGGTGRVTAELLLHGFVITALDASAEMIRLAKIRFPESDRIKYVHTDFCAWKSTDKYDLIIAWDSVFHVPQEQQQSTIEKMCSLLNPAGILLFTGGAPKGKASGEMFGETFEYGSIGYLNCLQTIENMNCKIILMEEDQFPAGHMVFAGRR